MYLGSASSVRQYRKLIFCIRLTGSWESCLNTRPPTRIFKTTPEGPAKYICNGSNICDRYSCILHVPDPMKSRTENAG